MIILSEENIKQLDALIQEMPTKYGLPLIQFFSKLNEAQNVTITAASQNSSSGNYY